MMMIRLMMICLLFHHGAVAGFCAAAASQNPAWGSEGAQLRDQIVPGDAISIGLIPGEEYSREVLVQPDGKIQLPLIGTLSVKGLGVMELQRLLEEEYSKYLDHPQASVNIRRFTGRRVAIIGEVRKPGYYDFRDGMTLLELISLAEGPTQDAKTSNVKVLRSGESGGRSFSVNFNAVLRGDLSRNPPLAPGDTVNVPKYTFTTGAAWVQRNVLPWAVVTGMLATIIVATRTRR